MHFVGANLLNWRNHLYQGRTATDLFGLVKSCGHIRKNEEKSQEEVWLFPFDLLKSLAFKR